MSTPEIVTDVEIVSKEIGPVIDNVLAEAGKIAASIVNDETRDRALDIVAQVDEAVSDLKAKREKHYIPLYRAAEGIRELFDPKLKKGKAIIETIMGSVSDYNVRKEREARIARERAEAEARKAQEEAARKQREAEEAERKAKEAIEAEKQRKKEAEAAEQRRIIAEREAKERAEREAREAANRERERKLKEEEDARLAHAQEAHDVGNTGNVGSILDTPTPISPILGGTQAAHDEERLALESKLAREATEAKAKKEREEQEAAEKRRRDAEELAAKARADAEAAQAKADEIEASAAAQAVATRPDKRTISRTTFKWEFDSNGTEEGDCAAFLLLVKAVAEGRAPIEYLGFDPKHPEKFRSSAINEDVQLLREKFKCPGLKAFPQQNEYLRRGR